jgi:hypothetical protein
VENNKNNKNNNFKVSCQWQKNETTTTITMNLYLSIVALACMLAVSTNIIITMIVNCIQHRIGVGKRDEEKIDVRPRAIKQLSERDIQKIIIFTIKAQHYEIVFYW